MPSKVSIYSNITDNDSKETIELEEIFNKIKSKTKITSKINRLRNYVKKGEKAKYDNGKKSLPAFTSTGIFFPTRKSEHIQKYTQIITLDIDKIPDKINEVKKKSTEIPETLASFISPSGIGLKILVKIDTRAKDHKTAYNIVRTAYERLLKVELDAKNDDIPRLCIASYDENLYYNPNAKIFMVATKLEQEKIAYAITLTEKKYEFEEGSRNSFVFQLACFCNLLGVSEEKAKECFISQYEENGFEADEIIGCIESGYKNKSVHNTWSVNQKKENTDNQEREITNLYAKAKNKYNLQSLTEFEFLHLLLDDEKDKSLRSLCESYQHEILQGFQNLEAKSIFEEALNNKKDTLDDWEENKYPKLYKTTVNHSEYEEIPSLLRIRILDFKVEKLVCFYEKTLFQLKFSQRNQLAKAKELLNKTQEIIAKLNKQIITMLYVLKDEKLL